MIHQSYRSYVLLFNELAEVEETEDLYGYVANAVDLISFLYREFSQISQDRKFSTPMERLFIFLVDHHSMDGNTREWQAKLNELSPTNIGTYPLRAFLSYYPDTSHIYHDKVRLLQGLILISAYSEGSLPERITTAFMHIRMIINKEMELASAIPELGSNINDWLKALKEKAYGNPRLLAIHLVLSDFYLGQKDKKKVSHKPKFKSDYQADSITKPASRVHSLPFDPEDGAHYINIHHFNHELIDSPVDREERSADVIQVSAQLDIKLNAPEEHKQSKIRQAIKSRQIANQLIKRNKMLITDTGVLTRLQIQCCLAVVYEADGSPEAAVVALMLLTGLPLEKVVNLKLKGNLDRHGVFIRQLDDEYYALVRNVILPEHKLENIDQSKLIRSDKQVELPLPLFLSRSIEKVLCSDSEALSMLAAAYISDLSVKNKTRISSAKISQYFAFWLNKTGVDSAKIEALCGSGDLISPSIYYSQVPLADIQGIYFSYIKRMIGINKNDITREKQYIGLGYRTLFADKDTLIGSQLMVEANTVKALFTRLEGNIKRELTVKNRDNHELHNSITLYMIMLLNLSTGHRPVNDPYDAITSINTFLSTIVIADKDTRSTNNSKSFASVTSRILVLPELAKNQITQYIDYLKSYESLIRPTGTLLAKHYEKVINGDAPLFFYRSGENILNVSVREQQERITKIWNLPPNWHRHFMRTQLVNRQVNKQLLDTWMGHAEFGNESFSNGCGIKISDMKEVASNINEFLTAELDLRMVAFN